MAAHVSDRTAYEQTRREHELLRERLKSLHHQLEERQVPLGEIERQLKELRDCLETHFRNEEREGFFDQVVSRAPQLARQAESLSHEHADLSLGLDSLVRFAERGADHPQGWQTLTQRFEDLMKQLMHHEAEENGMLQRAYQEDLGTKD